MPSRQNVRSRCPAQRALATLAASDNPHVLDEREGPGLGRLHMTGGVRLASPLPPPYPARQTDIGGATDEQSNRPAHHSSPTGSRKPVGRLDRQPWQLSAVLV